MSTKKYETLVRLYADEIAEIKRLQAIADSDLAAAQDAGKETDDEYEAFIQGQQAYRAYEASAYALNLAAEKLYTDIDAEYANVPFEAARKAGIEKFYESAFDDARLHMHRS